MIYRESVYSHGGHQNVSYGSFFITLTCRLPFYHSSFDQAILLFNKDRFLTPTCFSLAFLHLKFQSNYFVVDTGLFLDTDYCFSLFFFFRSSYFSINTDFSSYNICLDFGVFYFIQISSILSKF